MSIKGLLSLLLSAITSFSALSLRAQNWIYPLPPSETERMYEKHVRIQRLPPVAITHADAYRIRTQKPAIPRRQHK